MSQITDDEKKTETEKEEVGKTATGKEEVIASEETAEGEKEAKDGEESEGKEAESGEGEKEAKDGEESKGKEGEEGEEEKKEEEIEIIREDEDDTIYRVVVNIEEQYSIWPECKDIPLGWRDAGKVGKKRECLEFVKEVWTDMRPLSLRKQMEEAERRRAQEAEQQ